MIDFATKEAQQKAIQEGPKNPQVMLLTVNPEQHAYVQQAQTQAERRKYIQLRK